MQLGVHVVRFTWPGGTEAIAPVLGRAARIADDAGVARLSVMDHYFQMEAMFPADEPMLEGYTTLGFLAAHTSRLRLGLLVTGATYRHPGLLAKIVTTLDVLSGGRAELGIGTAWYDREHYGLGVPFPPIAERFERLEETLRICRQMWSDDNGPFEGRHYQLAETLCVPAPISRPRLPILIGGSGEKKTLRLVATYADACNLFAPSVDEVAHKLDVLKAHCDRAGRDYAEITKTILYRGDALTRGEPSAFLAEMEQYARIGVDAVIVTPPGGEPADAWIERACVPVVKDLADIGTGS
ncbi:LLM class F420-dependent oxidoreductase [Frankia sp. CiP3]|uniref:LLM class F420-dependent oxidoreductase n=1 Tax=Frankia sp. CiP3 TaxID=2880971 RepID=UPI001EF446DB|nr:LLM class F420-dependent oxidoreductase [Frankia sp. CiP3]